MNERDHLKAELRAVREELAHRDITKRGIQHGSMLSPPLDIQFARLAELTDEQLEAHEERLERDLEDMDIDEPNQLYRPTETDTNSEPREPQ